MATRRTIGDVAAHGALLQASCRACGHMAVIDPRSLPARYRAMALDAVVFRCTRCGARGGVAVRQPRSKASPANPQRVANLYANGAHLGALCSTCQPVRRVYFTLAEIALIGSLGVLSVAPTLDREASCVFGVAGELLIAFARWLVRCGDRPFFPLKTLQYCIVLRIHQPAPATHTRTLTVGPGVRIDATQGGIVHTTTMPADDVALRL